MKFCFRKYISLFLLGTFLFAYTEKDIHDILHADDIHCHVFTEKHFHNVEHHCGICDFEFPWSDKASTSVRVSCFHQYNDLNFIFPDSNISVEKFSTRSSRAPPVA